MTAGALVEPSPPIRAFVRRVEQILATDPDGDVGRQVMDALGAILGAPDLLAPAQRVGAAESYQRHLLHGDAEGRFTALALVWRSGQVSPVHGHTAWCAVGVVSGVATEERYELEATPRGVVARHLAGRDARHGPGAVLMTRPGADGVHRIRNDGSEDVVTIHVYGCDLRVDPTGINVVYPD